MNVEHLKKYQDDFIKKTKATHEIELPRKYFLPLAAKVLNRNFNLKAEDYKAKKLAEQKLAEFVYTIENYTDKYIREGEMSENAYTFFNVITDYASNVKHLQARYTNDFQTKCGSWLNQIGTKAAKPEFSWDDEVKDYAYLLSEQ